MDLTKEQLKEVEKLRGFYRKKAYGVEVKTGKAPKSIATVQSVKEVLEVFPKKPLHGEEAEQAAKDLMSRADPIAALDTIVEELDDATLNYLYASVDYRYYCKKYFPHYFTKDFSPLYHDAFFDIIRPLETNATRVPGVVMGPRGWGKTAIGSVVFPTHAIIFPVIRYHPDGSFVDLSKKYIGLFCVAKPNSQKLLGSICYEFEDNEAIRADFGEFYRDPDRKKFDRAREWSKSGAVTTNNRRLEAHSRKSKARGLFWRGRRLDLTIGDDLEDDENIGSARQRDRDMAWFLNIVMNCKSSVGNILVLGNKDHPDGLNSRLVDHGAEAGWAVKVFKVSETDPDTGKKVYTWPQYYGAKFEKDMRKDITDEAYEMQYQQDPEAYTRELRHEHISYYRMKDIQSEIGGWLVYAAVDPASTVGKRSDDTAIVPIACDPKTRVMYVLQAVLGKIPISSQPEAVLGVHCQWDTHKFGAESVAYQAALHSNVRELAQAQGIHINLVPIKQGSNISKHRRIGARLFGRIQQGQIKFLAGDPTHARIVEQLIRMGTPGVKDDGADALEMAVRMRDEDVMSGARRKGRRFVARIA